MERPEIFYEPKAAGLEGRIKEWLSLRRKS
jgi:hypothetical protein